MIPTAVLKLLTTATIAMVITTSKNHSVTNGINGSVDSPFFSFVLHSFQYLLTDYRLRALSIHDFFFCVNIMSTSSTLRRSMLSFATLSTVNPKSLTLLFVFKLTITLSIAVPPIIFFLSNFLCVSLKKNACSNFVPLSISPLRHTPTVPSTSYYVNKFDTNFRNLPNDKITSISAAQICKLLSDRRSTQPTSGALTASISYNLLCFSPTIYTTTLNTQYGHSPSFFFQPIDLQRFNRYF